MTDSTTVQVAPSNVDQLGAWDGNQGAFWADRADRFDEGVARYHEQYLAAAEIEPGATVLDVGCGNGKTTRDAARLASAGSVLGVDLSSRMVELARRRAEREQVANATFLQADVQVHPFAEGYFDRVISRHGAMFFGDPPAAFANLFRAVRPGGRLVLLSWQPVECNEWISTFRSAFAGGKVLPPLPTDRPSPMGLSVPEQVRELLGAAGFVQVRLTGLSESMYFGKDVDDACQFIVEQFSGLVNALEPEVRAAAIDGLRENMAAHQTDEGVLYDSAAWLIEARRAV